MLQELDQLANRISRLVSYSERLKSERAELLARVKLVEQERTTLRDQLSTQQTEYSSMAEIVTRHQHEIETAKRLAEDAQESLYAELIQQQDELQLLRQQLTASQTKADQLEAAALQANALVDNALQRLPQPVPMPTSE